LKAFTVSLMIGNLRFICAFTIIAYHLPKTPVNRLPEL